MSSQKPDRQRNQNDLFYSLNLPMARHKVLRDENGFPVDFIWTEVNEAFCSYFDKPASDFIDKMASTSYPSELETWRMHYIEKDGIAEEVTARSYHKTIDRHVEFRYFSESRDHFTVVFIDNTRLEKASRELKESQKILTNILSAIPMRIFWKDQNSVFLGGNTAFANDLGVGEPEDMIGKTDFDFGFTREEAEGFRKDDREVIQKKIPKLFFEEKQTHADGSRSWVKTSKIPLMDDLGEVQGVLGIYEDVTAQREAELHLQKSEQHLRTTLHSIGDAVIDTDVHGLIRSMNPVAEMLTGVGLSEAAGKTIDEVFVIVDPRTEELLEDPVARVIGLNRKHFLDNKGLLLSADGSRYHISYTATPIKYNNEGLLGVVLVFRDITEEYKSRRRLEFTNYTLEQAKNAILWVDKDGRFIYTNKTVQDWLQYSKEELENMYVPDIDPVFTWERWPGHWEELKALRSMKIESYHRRKNGEMFPVELYLNYVLFEGKEYNLAFINDLTEKREAEKKLKHQTERFDVLFSNMSDVVTMQELIRDENGKPVGFKIVDCNRAFETLTGLKKEDVTGKPVSEVYRTGNTPFFKEFLTAIESGKPYEFMTYRGEIDKHFKIQIVPISDNQVATLTTDFTEIKLIEHVLRNKNMELENYLYVASHDMRSPLVNIQGFSQRLQKQIDGAAKQINSEELTKDSVKVLGKTFNTDIPKTLDFIYTNVDKMNMLIDGLLKISRTGRTIMEIRRIDMNELLERVIKSFNYQFDEQKVQVVLTELPACFGDEQLLNSLFSNLISNCYKYRDRKRNLSIQIEGKIFQSRAVYSISDNGIGIPERHLDKIWDVFYRIDPLRFGEGEGLGLSIVKRIVDKHKGDVTVESVEGTGSVFHISLPVKSFTE